MHNFIDLHTHSCASDGSDSPSEIVEKAKKFGLKALALTDHDTFNGLAEASQKAKDLGIEFIQGIELSADHTKGEIHILGYWLEEDKNPLEDAELMKNVAMLQEIREQRNTKLLSKLQEVNVPLTKEDVIEEMNGERLMCRPHFAKAMVKKGYVPDMQSAFDKYLAEDGLAYIPKETIEAVTAIDILLKAKAFVVLAHPMLIRCKTEEERYALIKKLKDSGLQGIEAHYSANSYEDTKQTLKYAEEFDLIPTGGSDYHGSVKPKISLGSGHGDLRIGYDVLTQIKDFIHKQKTINA